MLQGSDHRVKIKLHTYIIFLAFNIPTLLYFTKPPLYLILGLHI